MEISQAQHDVRASYRGGATGTAVSGAVWVAASATAQWVGIGPAIAVLFVGGAMIFPLSALLLRALGGPVGLPRGHPMNALGTQLAMVVPLGVILAALAALDRPEWFFPFAAAIVGAHYFPFVFLYGMKEYAVLGAALVVVGLGLAVAPSGVTTAGWATGALELASAPALWILARRSSLHRPTEQTGSS
ncbi:MAG: hypothetical protein WA966_01670 [Ornithinimicrobium sp.]